MFITIVYGKKKNIYIYIYINIHKEHIYIYMFITIVYSKKKNIYIYINIHKHHWQIVILEPFKGIDRKRAPSTGRTRLAAEAPPKCHRLALPMPRGVVEPLGMDTLW